jgi:hypothetical protein
MELSQAWRMRLSFRNATVVVCFLNVVTALLLLQDFISSASSRSKISDSVTVLLENNTVMNSEKKE